MEFTIGCIAGMITASSFFLCIGEPRPGMRYKNVYTGEIITITNVFDRGVYFINGRGKDDFVTRKFFEKVFKHYD